MLPLFKDWGDFATVALVVALSGVATRGALPQIFWSGIRSGEFPSPPRLSFEAFSELAMNGVRASWSPVGMTFLSSTSAATVSWTGSFLLRKLLTVIYGNKMMKHQIKNIFKIWNCFVKI